MRRVQAFSDLSRGSFASGLGGQCCSACSGHMSLLLAHVSCVQLFSFTQHKRQLYTRLPLLLQAWSHMCPLAGCKPAFVCPPLLNSNRQLAHQVRHADCGRQWHHKHCDGVGRCAAAARPKDKDACGGGRCCSHFGVRARVLCVRDGVCARTECVRCMYTSLCGDTCTSVTRPHPATGPTTAPTTTTCPQTPQLHPQTLHLHPQPAATCRTLSLAFSTTGAA
jgi:hypothetical protein